MRKKIIGILIVIGSILFVGFLMSQKKPPAIKPSSAEKKFKVIVDEVRPEYNSIIMESNGNLQPLWQTQLSSEVSGLVTEVSDKLLDGASFSAGDTLLKIDATRYVAELALAESQLADAHSLLEEEKVKAEKARFDWQRVNPNKKAADYTLRLPQLKSAEKKYQSAMANLKQAQRNLSLTTIKAPYNGSVLNRTVNLGEVIQAGTPIAQIFSLEQLELVTSLREDQIQTLKASEIISIKVSAGNPSDLSYSATVSRIEQIIDSNNRGRQVYLQLSNSLELQQSLPTAGEFLMIDFFLKPKNQTIEIKERALSVDGHVWVVDKDNVLKRLKPEILYKASDSIFIKNAEDWNRPLQIVSFPSSSLIEGMQVEPESINDGPSND